MNLAITAIFQNEARYLKEWIEFHLLMGVEHFYLFDHLSTDQPETVLAPYLASGVVQMTKWPLGYTDVYEWTEVQCLAYERALHWACGKTKWLALLDVDEFLFSTRAPLLEELEKYEEFGGVAVNWQLFGTSNVAQLGEKELLIERLIFRVPVEQQTNHHVKSIVRPERVRGCDNAHSMLYHSGFYQVNTQKVPFEGCLSPTIEIDPLRIHHYTLRDEHFLTTCKIPRLQKWWPDSPDEWRAKYKEMNAIEDTTLHRFLPDLKRSMA